MTLFLWLVLQVVGYRLTGLPRLVFFAYASALFVEHANIVTENEKRVKHFRYQFWLEDSNRITDITLIGLIQSFD